MKKFFSKFRDWAFIALLSLSVVVAPITMTGCTPTQVAQFEQVLNQIAPATLTILQIIALFKTGIDVNTLPAKVGADVAAVEKLFTDYEAAATNAKATVLAQLNAGFSVLQGDFSTVLTLAHVSDVNTQAKLTALVGLIGSALRIAEGFIIVTPAATAVQPLKLTPGSFVDSWNAMLTAKTGNAQVDAFTAHNGHLHLHGKFVRVVSLGMAN